MAASYIQIDLFQGAKCGSIPNGNLGVCKGKALQVPVTLFHFLIFFSSHSIFVNFACRIYGHAPMLPFCYPYDLYLSVVLSITAVNGLAKRQCILCSIVAGVCLHCICLYAVR